MKYELNLLESMATGKNAGSLKQEAARIRDVFLNMALSHKKQPFLRRYFRVHREGLESLRLYLQDVTLTKRKKLLLTMIVQLAAWMDSHLSQFVEDNPALQADDPDIDARKIITTCNLQELGVVLRLYLETGIIRVRNQKAMTRFMSQNIVVRNRQVQQGFSDEYLYNAIHSPNEQAMDKVQAKLNEMLVKLNQLRRAKRKKEKEEK